MVKSGSLKTLKHISNWVTEQRSKKFKKINPYKQEKQKLTSSTKHGITLFM